MLIDVLPTPDRYDAQDAAGAVAVIDVFRVGTTIITAFANGCRLILPAADVEQALKLIEPYAESEAVLAGERGAKRIDGFQLGNSPSEFSKERVSGKVIVLTTTNGTKALLAARNAEMVLVGSLLNLSRLAEELKSQKRVTVLCAGNEGRLSLEDFVCAGGLVAALEESGPTLTDSARAARAVFGSARRSLAKLLRDSDHGQRLTELGFKADIDAALRIDSVPVVPRFEENRIFL